MKPIPIIIADDDPGMRQLLTGIVAKSEGYELMGAAEDGEQLLELYERTKPQAVIMDVEMPGLTGIECARIIQDRDPRCVLIFVTAHEKYMGDAFEVYAFDYLRKPFPIDRALETLRRAALRIGDMNVRAAQAVSLARPARKTPAGKRLMIRGKEGLSFVDVDEIVLIQREDRQTHIYCEDGRKYVTGDSLSEIEEKLDPGVFFRSHKSYIINLNHVDTVTPYGRWTYVVTLEGTEQDALITADKFEELKQVFS
ncbi:MAG: response regulator transcription factor [Clostridia bacterium]|nr:response regulator transcription factor [Clostridia bacterium]MBQ4085985.1 response regulator transcription factor [Clostridia bacterium]